MATVEIELTGSADGVPMDIAGTGQVDPARLTLEVQAAPSLLLLDPTLIALGFLDVLALAATCPCPTDPHVHVRSRTDQYDEHGRDAGGWRVVAAVGRTGGGVRLDGQLLDHVIRIEPGERVVAVDAPWAVVAQPVEDESVLLAGAWGVRTGRGNGYRGVTVTIAGGLWQGGAAAVRVAFQAVQNSRGEGDKGESVAIQASVATNRVAEPLT